MLRVLGAFNLSEPTTAPAQLLTALLIERSWNGGFAWDGPNAKADHATITQALSWMQFNNEPGWRALSDARVRVGSTIQFTTCTTCGHKSLDS